MANLDTTALAAVLKQKYSEKAVAKLCYKNNPFYAMIAKNTKFGGKNKQIAVRNATPQGRSHTFSTAQTNATASVYSGFTITRNSDYCVATISGEAIDAAKGDENTLVEGLREEINGAIFTAMRNIGIEMFRNGGAARGRVSTGSTVSATSITLATPADITNFEVGMKVRVASTDGTSGSLRTGTTTILAVDRDLGTLTTSEAAWNTTITALATSDYLFQEGDFGSGLKGLAAWLPATAPGATTFFGLDRSTDVTRLGGIRYNGSGGPIEETLVEAAARAAREGAMSDVCFMNPLDYSNLVKALGAKVEYDRVNTDIPDIGFKAAMVQGPMGPIKVLSDLNCPKGSAFLLQMDTWSLETLGAAPRILDADGQTILRSATSDAYELRVGYYGQVACYAPGWNVNITL